MAKEIIKQAKEADFDIEFKWAENVAKAREYVQVKERNQMVIAALALEVCEISWGGAKFSDTYNLTRFGKEIGVNPREVSAWVAVKKRVYDKLPKKLQDGGIPYSRLNYACRFLSKDASIEKTISTVQSLAGNGNPQYTITKYLCTFRSASSALIGKNYIGRIDEPALKEVLFYCTTIAEAIRSAKPNIKPADMGLSTRMHRRKSAAEAMDLRRSSGERTILVKDNQGFEIRLTEKDRSIMKHMKRHKRFFTPTELGMDIGGHNSNSATAWACRTLNKLQSLEYVERNKSGHYRWISVNK